MDLNEAEKLSDLLHIEPKDFSVYFFTEKVAQCKIRRRWVNGKAKKRSDGERLHNSRGSAENAKGTPAGHYIVAGRVFYSLS